MRWFNFKSQDKVDISVSLGEEYLAAVGRKGESIIFFESAEVEQNKEQALSSFLNYLSGTYKLVNATAHLIFEHSQYQLLMTDALDVERAELANALKWKVKDLLEYRVSDVLVDAFLVPPHGNANNLKKAFVAASSLSEVKRLQDIFKQHLFALTEVSIALLAERNLLSLLPSHKSTDILVSFCENYCYISLVLKGDVYFVRKLLNQGTSSLLEFNEEGSCELLLELQRSIDYCVSNLKLPEVKRIIFPYIFSEHFDALNAIKKLLSQEVILIDVNDYLELGSTLSKDNQVRCWYALGAFCDSISKKVKVLDAAS